MGRRTNTAVWLEKYKRWQIKVQQDGERKTFTCSTPGRVGQRECNGKADAWLDDHISDQNKRVSVLYDEFIAFQKLTTSKSNWLKIDSFGKNWINPNIGKKKISMLNEQMLQDIIAKAFAKGLSKKTLTNLRATIVSFLKYCRKGKYTALFPEGLTIPKGARSTPKNILQPDDLVKLFQKDEITLYGKQAKDPLVYAYRFQVLTGLRPGELIGLRWADIHGGEVHIQRSINAYKEVTTGKNENAIRCFALSAYARQMLEEQRTKNPQGESIFEIISLSSYQKSWRRFCEQNQITYISPYELRHTFVSVVKALPDGQVKSVVGHSKSMDTFGIYGHEVEGERQKTAEGINDLFDHILQSGLNSGLQNKKEPHE